MDLVINRPPDQGGQTRQPPAVNGTTQKQSSGLKIAPGSVIPVQLSKTVDAKKAKAGDEVVLSRCFGSRSLPGIRRRVLGGGWKPFAGQSAKGVVTKTLAAVGGNAFGVAHGLLNALTGLRSTGAKYTLAVAPTSFKPQTQRRWPSGASSKPPFLLPGAPNRV